MTRGLFLDAEFGSFWILTMIFPPKIFPLTRFWTPPVTFIVVLVAPVLFKVFRKAVLFWVNWKVADPEEHWSAVGFERIDEIFLCWISFKLL